MGQKELTDLAKQIYGSSDKRVKELQSMYHATQIQIEGIISEFVSDDDNWNLPAPKRLKEQLLSELMTMYREADSGDQALIAVAMTGRSIATINESVKVSAGIALLSLAHQRRVQLADTLQEIPQQVRTVGYRKATKKINHYFNRLNGRPPTTAEHEYELARRIPGKYLRWFRNLALVLIPMKLLTVIPWR